MVSAHGRRVRLLRDRHRGGDSPVDQRLGHLRSDTWPCRSRGDDFVLRSERILMRLRSPSTARGDSRSLPGRNSARIQLGEEQHAAFSLILLADRFGCPRKTEKAAEEPPVRWRRPTNEPGTPPAVLAQCIEAPVVAHAKVCVLLEHRSAMWTDRRPSGRRTRSSRNNATQLGMRIGRRGCTVESS